MKNASTYVTVLSLCIGACMVSAPFGVAAETTYIVNQTSSSANSGGNSASSGQVVEGESRSEVHVYTEVNGEVVEDYQETSNESINHEFSHTGDGASVQQGASASASAGSDTSRGVTKEIDKATPKLFEASLDTDESGESNATTTTTTSVVASTGSPVVKEGSVFTRIAVSIKETVTNIFAYVLNLF